MLSWRRPPANLYYSLSKSIPTTVRCNASTNIKTNQICSLNSQLKDLVAAGFFERAIELYRTLRSSKSEINGFTFPYALKACSSLHAIDEGSSIHTHILKTGFAANPFVMNSLVEMYSRFGFLSSARRTFDEITTKNPVSWNLMISSYGSNECHSMALELCRSMMREGMPLDDVGLKIVLPICGQLGALNLGESIHAHVIVRGSSADFVLTTAILDTYCKCADIDAANRVFEEIRYKDSVAWNAMIAGYSHVEKPEMVLELFRCMVLSGIEPSIPTILLALQACARETALLMGKSIHCLVTKSGFGSDISVQGLLVDMYSKCGELSSACSVFKGISKGDVNSWSCMINGLGIHGYGVEALMGFFKMLKSGIEPDSVCWLVVLSSCGHCGMVDEGRRMFEYMVNLRTDPARLQWVESGQLF